MDTVGKLQAFANKHKIVLQEKGECGFGRPCVGLMHGDNYVDHNPMRYPDYSHVWAYDDRLCAPDGVQAYHKHDCLAVLAPDDNYQEALEQLLAWVECLESHGELEVVEYQNGATGLQAAVSGVFGKAIRLKQSKEQAA